MNKYNQKSIFITGCTGLLGSEIVRYLIENTNSNIFLLVRDSEGQTAEQKIKKTLQFLFKKNLDTFNRRISIIPGNITGKYMGLSKSDWERIAVKTEVIFHCAALINFGKSLREHYETNVTGTKNVLDFAVQCCENGRFSHINHVSTAGVSSIKKGCARETPVPLHKRIFFGLVVKKILPAFCIRNGIYFKYVLPYLYSKILAESLVFQYSKKGVKFHIFRPSGIEGHSQTGERINFRGGLFQVLHICTHNIFEELPFSDKTELNIVPADCVARAMCILSEDAELNNQIFHLTNPNRMKLKLFLESAAEYFDFQKPKLIDINEFDLEKLSNFQLKLIEPFLSLAYFKEISYSTENSNDILAEKGFSWPNISKEMLEKMFYYAEKVKYIEHNVYE